MLYACSLDISPDWDYNYPALSIHYIVNILVHILKELKTEIFGYIFREICRPYLECMIARKKLSPRPITGHVNRPMLLMYKFR